MSQNLNSTVAVIGIDIGKNSFHVVGLPRDDQEAERDNERAERDAMQLN